MRSLIFDEWNSVAFIHTTTENEIFSGMNTSNINYISLVGIQEKLISNNVYELEACASRLMSIRSPDMLGTGMETYRFFRSSTLVDIGFCHSENIKMIRHKRSSSSIPFNFA